MILTSCPQTSSGPRVTSRVEAEAGLHEVPISTLAALLRNGQLTSRRLTEHCLERIQRLDGALHSFVAVTGERALIEADRADRELASGVDRGPLHGIPYAVKDVFDAVGAATTCHSWLRLDHHPVADSTAVARMTNGGAVLVGKLATHEFALGGPSAELPFPPARNPWNHDHVPGASSSGSGVAVAAGLVRVALGTDTTGSIRLPALHCGVVGLKPTFGLVSRAGTFPLSHSLDHCGPLARTVHEVTLVLDVLEGRDPKDPASVDRPDWSTSARTVGSTRRLDGVRVGWTPTRLERQGTVHAEVWAQLHRVVEVLAERGATVVEVELPDLELFNACGRLIMAAEAFSIHQDDIRRNPTSFGRYTYQRVAAGATVSASDLVVAQQVRRELAEALDDVLRTCDVLLEPGALAPAPRFADFPEDWPPPRFASASQTVEFDVTGHPALALPTGFSTNGLPLGVQLAGRCFDEATVIRVAEVLEAHLEFDTRRPPGCR